MPRAPARSARRDVELHRQHALEPGHELRESRGEAVVGQHGGVEAARQLADLGDRERELLLGPLQQLRRAAPPSGRRADRDAQRLQCDDQPLLGAVVEVALEPPPLGVPRPHEPLVGGAELALGLRSSVASRTIVTTSLSSIGTTRASNWRSSPRIVRST